MSAGLVVGGIDVEVVRRGAGHHPEIEQPRAFVDTVVKFLNR